MALNRSNIEWIHPDPQKRRTWNPVTGCMGPAGDGVHCPYCYAVALAAGRQKRFYPKGFSEVKFHPERLGDLKPGKASTGKGVFVGSMCDLFAPSVPYAWIDSVFGACEKAPQHIYYFLTKNTRRYNHARIVTNMVVYPNWHFGFSASTQSEYVHRLSIAPIPLPFVSLEPLFGPVSLIAATIIKENPAYNPKWVIVGARTAPLTLPKKEWVLDIRRQCKDAGIPLFEKNSLRKLDLPGGLIQEWLKSKS